MRLKRTILGVLLVLGGGCVFGQRVCSARTPQQTLPAGWKIQSSRTIPLASPAIASRYRLSRVVADPVLHRRWAFIENCTHPERPLQMVALASAAGGLPVLDTTEPFASPVARIPVLHPLRQAAVPPPAISVRHSPIPQPVQSVSASSVTPYLPMAPLVRAGDRVRLWISEPNVRLEIDAVALEYGHAGQVIHLRRLGQRTLLAGVVVGNDSAELMP